MARRLWLSIVAAGTLLVGYADGNEERGQALSSQQTALLAKVTTDASRAKHVASPMRLVAPAPAFTIYWNNARMWLHKDDPHLQICLTLFATCAGIAMLVDGEHVFRILAIFVSFVAMTCWSQSQLQMVWEGATPFWCWFVAVEAGLTFAFIVLKGYEGAKILMGAGLGFWTMWRVSLFISANTAFTALNVPGVAIVCYSIFVGLGVLTFTIFHRQLLSLIAPALGGLMVASSTGFTTTAIVQALQPKLKAHITLNPTGSEWIDFCDYLLGLTQEPVGILGDRRVGSGAYTVRDDKLLGTFLWIFLWLLGMFLHHKSAKKKSQGGKYAQRTEHVSR